MASALQLNPFATKEDRFVLSLLIDKPLEEKELEEINWGYVSERVFPNALYPLLKQSSYKSLKSVLEVMSESHLRNVVYNEYRLRKLSKILKPLLAKEIEVVLLKGGAELVEHYANTAYLGGRSMSDIDFLCKACDIEAVHNVFMSQEYLFDGFGLSEKDREYILKLTGHWVYKKKTADLFEAYEAHVDSYVFKAHLESYPKDFADAILAGSKSVSFNNVMVKVPSKEHQWVHLLTHAASWWDYRYFANCKSHVYDEAVNASQNMSLIDNRFRQHQLRFLLQADLFLSANGDIDFDKANSLFSRVGDGRLVDMHINLVKLYTKHVIPSVDGGEVDEEAFLKSRKALLEEIVSSQKGNALIKRLLNDKQIFKLKAMRQKLLK